MASAYVEIPLGGQKAAGRVALVDTGDYELVIKHRWWVKERVRPYRTDGPYVVSQIRRDGRRSEIRMHGLITGRKDVDHRNHDGLDNRRSNLRDGAGWRNDANKRPRLNSRSQYKGIRWHGPMQKWQVRITVQGARKSLGYFADEKDAARAYDAAARDAFGEYACLNFP